jgi:hypothetical protein
VSAARARPSTSPHGRAPPGAPAHTLIVMLENHSYSQVIGRSSAPFLNELARGGALFTNSRAITHYSVLHTIENLYHLRPLGHAAHATPITNVWEMR